MAAIFKLTAATAVTIDRELGGKTRNRPVLAQCEIGDASLGRMGDLVVKIRPGSELTSASLGNEVVGALLAQYFDIKTPDPAIVEIPVEVSNDIPDSNLRSRVSQSIGANFGTRYISQSPVFKSLTDKNLQEGINIFAFDMLIQNLDRRTTNPNLFETPDGLLAFDHELAFSFADPLAVKMGMGQDPCDFRSAIPVNDHVMTKSLKGKNCGFDAFIDLLQGLSDDLIAAICSQVPAQWHTSRIGLIAKHLCSARKKAHKFKSSLQAALI